MHLHAVEKRIEKVDRESDSLKIWQQDGNLLREPHAHMLRNAYISWYWRIQAVVNNVHFVAVVQRWRKHHLTP